MSAPITNPPNPYVGAIEGGLAPGKIIRVQGTVPPVGNRFNINLQVGPNINPRDDVGLHISVRLQEGYIARNSLEAQQWGAEQGHGSLPIGLGQMFEILILADHNQYKIAVNGQHYCEFPLRIPLNRIKYLAFDGDVAITLLSYEGGAAPPSAPPPGGHAPGGQYGPPPPGAYGPPGQHYGGGPPPPPGYDHQKESESGFGNILEQAGSAIAGAVASGALSNLLSNVSAGGGGQPGSHPQQQTHQPAAPQQNPQSPLGGLGSLLGGVLGGGSNAGPQQYGSQQQGGQQGGLGSLSSMLAGVLSSQTPSYPPQPQSANTNFQGGQMGGFGSIGSSLVGALAENILNPKKPQFSKEQRKAYEKALKKDKKAQEKAMKKYGMAAGAPGIGFVNPYHKPKKMKHNKALKYGLPVAGGAAALGLGAYAVGHHHKHHKHHRRSSSSSSSSSD